MRAAVYEAFQSEVGVQTVPDPEPSEFGAVIAVCASGVCRSDWHGWMGHDSDIQLPHVPGHEFAGTVAAVGRGVTRWKQGDRVTMPFMGVCGTCAHCASGDHQMCDDQFQPGFKRWGSYAEYVGIDFADANLVAVPAAVDLTTAASLGCRFATSFRALAFQAGVRPGQWVAVHGCGGIGLSAIMIAEALGANTIAIDIADDKLDFARSIGATHTMNAAEINDTPGAIADLTGGGAHVSIDALGSLVTCRNSIECLAKKGKHVQIGLMAGEDALPPVPMGRVVLKELEILGSYGLQPHKYADMLAMIEAGKLQPEKLIGRTITLRDATAALPNMNSFLETGVAIIDRFE